MNDHLHPIREAVASFSPIGADKIKVGGTLLEPANEGDLTQADLEAIDREYEIAAKKEFLSAIASAAVNSGVHFLAPEGNGHGPSSSARMRCTCGWIGPDRFEWQDDMCRLLEDDKTRHLRGEA